MNFITRSFFTLVLALATLMAFSQKPTDPLPIDPNVRIGHLDNGLTYYIRQNSKPEKKVELRLVVNAGSILENEQQLGLAHFVEHMAFNGTKNFKKNQMISFLQASGVEFGADLNAYTSFDETVYILPIPTAKKEVVEKGFQILLDWAGGVTFKNKEIDKERGVVLEESRTGKGAGNRMSRVTFPKIFEGSAYANRLPIGTDDNLKNFPHDVLKQFYRDWYRPELMAVIVVGDIDPFDAEMIIRKQFSSLQNPAQVKPRTYSEVPARTKAEAIVVTDPEATGTTVQVYYSPAKSQPMKTVADYKPLMLDQMIITMLNQRLREATQKTDPPFLVAGGSRSKLVRGYEMFTASAVVGKGGPELALSALVQEQERIRKFGFTTSELERAKKSMLTSVEQALAEKDKTASAQLAAEYIRNFLEQEPIPGIQNEFRYYKLFLDKITLDEVDQRATELIPAASADKLVIYSGPEKSGTVPTTAALLKSIDDVGKMSLAPYQDMRVSGALFDLKPEAGTIVSEKQNAAIGTTELVLSNGVRVILKPTDFTNEQVLLNGVRPGGYYNCDAADRNNAEYASEVMQQMGVGEYSPVELQKALAGRNATVSLYLGRTSESVRGRSSTKDLETMLRLTWLSFTQPRMDDELFASYVTKRQAQVQDITSSPDVVFQDSLYKYLTGKHPWGLQVPTPQTFTNLDKNRILEIYRDRFANANGFTFALTGSFDMEKIKPMILRFLGGLPSTSQTSAFKDVGLRANSGPVKRVVYAGLEQKSMAYLQWTGEAKYSPEERLRILMMTELINIRLTEVLREKMGAVYGAGMDGGLSKIPSEYFTLSLQIPSCAPENVNKLITASLKEIEAMKKSGPSTDDLNKVKETSIQQYRRQIKDNNYWSGWLINYVELGLPLETILLFEQHMNSLTTQDIKTTANKYLDSKKYVQVVLMPKK